MTTCSRCAMTGACYCALFGAMAESSEAFRRRIRKIERSGDLPAFAVAFSAALSRPARKGIEPEDADTMKEAEFFARTLVNAIVRIRAHRELAAIRRRHSMRLVSD